jgi:hypothetical protein
MWLFHTKLNKNVFVANVRYLQPHAEYYVLWYNESTTDILPGWNVDSITLFRPPKDEGK